MNEEYPPVFTTIGCPAGKVSEEPGQQCKECEGRTVAREDGKGCVGCGAGEYYGVAENGGLVCTACTGHGQEVNPEATGCVCTQAMYNASAISLTCVDDPYKGAAAVGEHEGCL